MPYRSTHISQHLKAAATNACGRLLRVDNGNLAQQTVYSVANNTTNYQTMRMLFWDEDDRLNLVAGDGYLSYYAYGHDGNRAIKMTGNAAIDQTGTLLNSTNLENITIYPNEYLTVTQAEYTKYYYAGGNRIASKIGTGGFGKMTRLCTQDLNLTANANSLFGNALQLVTSATNQPADEYPADVCGGYSISTELLINPLPTFYIAQTSLNFTQNNLLQQFRQNLAGGTEPVYYFHSDHLGSASWITSGTGLPAQHLLYLPFGEHFVNERSAAYDERFTFTGKERDAETGYYYHGARFNSSDLGWISVDPKFDKYPSLTPYNYCAWNPIKLVDPDGEFYAHTHALIVFKAIMETGLSGILRFGLNNIMVMCWGTSVVSDLFLMNETKVHLDGFNSKGINDPKDLTSEYNNAISNYNISILNGDYSDAGVALHTIADFYSHSNYIELYSEYATYKNKSSDIEKIPTFSEAQQDEDLMSYIIPRLKTGCYPDIEDDLSNSHKGISKDSKRKITGKEPYMKSDKNMYDAAKATAQKEISNIIMENIQ